MTRTEKESRARRNRGLSRVAVMENDPITDDELLYRRVPVSKGWHDDAGLSPEAFDPRLDEVTGISVYRAKFVTVEQAAQGKSKQGYWVAVLRAGDLRRHGIQVTPRPEPDDPGHAELPDLTCHNRLSTEAQERKRQLTKLCVRVEGPYVQKTG
jgi:hypothetical protein